MLEAIFTVKTFAEDKFCSNYKKKHQKRSEDVTKVSFLYTLNIICVKKIKLINI